MSTDFECTFLVPAQFSHWVPPLSHLVPAPFSQSHASASAGFWAYSSHKPRGKEVPILMKKSLLVEAVMPIWHEVMGLVPCCCPVFYFSVSMIDQFSFVVTPKLQLVGVLV